MAKTANISLPNETMDRLNKESKKLGLNRSAYITMALCQKWKSEKWLEDGRKVLARLKDSV